MDTIFDTKIINDWVKTELVESVFIPTPNGKGVAEKIPVKVQVYRDSSGEIFFDNETLDKLEGVKALHILKRMKDKHNFNREQMLTIEHYLEDSQLLAEAIKNSQWDDVQLVIDYLNADIPYELALTDPAKFKYLRERVTDFVIKGYNLKNYNSAKIT